MAVPDLLHSLGPEIEDPEEETFLLFSESIPSQNLGFVDSKATVLDLTIDGRDLTIHQSPTILSSTRDGGTTGAVVWKINPLISTWLLSPSNPLNTHSLLTPSTTLLELGCGISGITALTLAPKIGTYILTDQQYIMKYLNQNLLENRLQSTNSSSTKSRNHKKGRVDTTKAAKETSPAPTNIKTLPLDWETSDIPSTLSSSPSIDIILACDCIYNSHLIPPLISTLTQICRIPKTTPSPTICVVAQQLRSPDIFEEWMRAFTRDFRVLRVGEEGGLSPGFVVHFGVLR